ncbi:MAG TPA: type II toxin-antitoxin system death-on-curing family toxin [Thermoanaerobaculia bacterium]
MDPQFLGLEEILAIHEDRIRKYGGSHGIRDLGLLESAMGTVSATFGGEFLHQSIFEMAAAYLFHISKNHPFIDGNKRTALACTLAFLRLNGVHLTATQNALYDLVIGTAEGRVSKAEIAVFLQRNAK